MISFPTTIDAAEATAGERRSGGTDVQDRRRLGLSHGDVVDLRDVAGLQGITWQAGAARLGAGTRIVELTRDAQLAAAYPAFVQAALGLATPQIRAMATLGGNLLQRVRCWYFRRPDGKCFKSGDGGCPARTGDHSLHVCFDLGPCVAPHPSTLGLALLAHDAEIELSDGQRWPIAKLYGDGRDPTREHRLPPTLILTAVWLPPAPLGEHGAYLRVTRRAHAEWPTVDVVARLVVSSDGMIRLARLCAGGVANIPLRLHAAENGLVGAHAGPEVFAAAAETAIASATPLPMTAYKVPLLQQAVQDALTLVASQVRT